MKARILFLLVISATCYANIAAARNYSYKTFLIEQDYFLKFIGVDSSGTNLSKDVLSYGFESSQQYGKYATSHLINLFYSRRQWDSLNLYLDKHFQNCGPENLLDTPVLNKFRNHIAALQKRYESKCNKKINDSLAAYIYTLYNDDQAIRQQLNANFNDPAKKDSLTAEMSKVDSLNHAAFKAIIDRYSYPTDDLVGAAMDKIGLLVVHSDESDNFNYLEPYYALACIGKVSWMLPEQIKLNLLWRFPNNGYSFLCWTRTDQNNKVILNDKAYFELHCLIKLLKDNSNASIEFYTTTNFKPTGQEAVNRLLNYVSAYLTENGISANRIKINPEAKVDATTGKVYLDLYKSIIAYKLS